MTDALVVMLTNARLDKKNLWGIVFLLEKRLYFYLVANGLSTNSRKA